MPLGFIKPLLRCIILIIDKEDTVIKELISWRGSRPLPKLPINESIFDKNDYNEISLEEQIEIRLNEYRLVNNTQNEVNIAAFLCQIWRANQDKMKQNSDEKKTKCWTPVKQSEELFVLIFHILNRIHFGENMKLGIDDQITVLDIENLIEMKV